MQRGNLAPVINRGPSNNVENRETFDSRNQVESNFLFFFFSPRPTSFSLSSATEERLLNWPIVNIRTKIQPQKLS